MIARENCWKKGWGYVLWQTFAPGEDTFSGTMMVEMDRGYADGSLQLRGDKTRDVERPASFLCQDCLDSTLASILEEGYGVGIVNFKNQGTACAGEKHIWCYFGRFLLNSETAHR